MATSAPGSASSAPAEFFKNAHERSLGVIKVKHDAALREKYSALLFDFPPITVEKVGKQLETPEGKAKAIGQLIGKHGGEPVKLDRRHANWTLESVPPGSASDKVSEQWYCRPLGAKAGERDLDFGWPGDPADFAIQLDLAPTNAKRDGCQIPPHDLMPTWAEQISRVTCPCTDPECG